MLSCAYTRLCVIGLAPSHVALKEDSGITTVDFNVGKYDRSEMKVTGKRKRVSKKKERRTGEMVLSDLSFGWCKWYCFFIS